MHYKLSRFTDKSVIRVEDNGLFTPINDDSIWWKEYKDWVAEGNVPEEAITPDEQAELDKKPAFVMREKRNKLLAETDWWASSDLTITDEQKEYRQKLRDLPKDATPELDSNNEVTGVTWPTKP